MWYKRRSAIKTGIPALCASFAFMVVGCQNETPHQEDFGKFSSTSTTTVQTPPPSLPSPPPAPTTSPTPSPVSPKSPPPPAPPAIAVPLPKEYYEWKKDEFKYQGVYSNRCVFPTSPDHKKGTMLDELFAWRDIINQNYEFAEDVIDIDPRDYVSSKSTFEEHFDEMTNSDSYIQKLRSLITDKSGRLKHGEYSVNMKKNLDEKFASLASYTDPVIRWEYHSEWNSRIPEYTYGIEWEYISEDIPRDFRVRYTKPDSPAAESAHGSPKVKRGDRLIKVNDFDFVNRPFSSNVKSVNEILFPNNLVDSTKFIFQDRDTNDEKTVYLKGAKANRYIHDRLHLPPKIHHTSVIETDLGNVAYLHLGRHGTELEEFHVEIEKFIEQKVNEIIVDLRYFDEPEYNWMHTRNESAFAFMILGKNKTTRRGVSDHPVWYQKVYRRVLRSVYRDIQKRENAKSTEQVSSYFGRRNPLRFNLYCPIARNPRETTGWNCARYLLFTWYEKIFNKVYNYHYFKTLNLNKVYIIVSKHSCNRAELFINALRGIDADIVLIGEKTCGNPYQKRYRHNCGISVEMIDARFYNEKNFTNYEDGFRPENSKSKAGISIPGCYVEDDLSKSIGDLEEPMLKAALQYRKDKTCPPVP